VRSRTIAVVIVHAGFAVAGIVTTLLGPLLPTLIARWSLSDTAGGLFFTLQFSGSMAGIASLGPLLSRRGYRVTFLLGFGCMSLGIATVLPISNAAGLAATSVFGYGLGLTLSAGNLWIGEVAGNRRPAALSILNLAWGVGAVSSSPLVMLAQSTRRPLMLLWVIAGFSGLVAAILAAMDVEPMTSPSETPPEKTVPGKHILTALGALFFLYVGTETCVGGWAATFAQRMVRNTGELWTLTPMLFWAGLLLGRALTPLLLREMSEQVLLIGGLVLGTIGIAALLLSQTFHSAAIYVTVTGFALASIYPILVSWMVGHYGRQSRRTGSVLFAMGCLGGATMPWLVGFIATKTNSLIMGLWIPLFGSLLMISVYAFTAFRRAFPLPIWRQDAYASKPDSYR
jgi:FHS family glucose/mannose:H+ symporter-like MFS transporter